MSFFQILKLASSDVTGIYFNTSHPLGQVFEAMMEKRQDQIPDEGFFRKWPFSGWDDRVETSSRAHVSTRDIQSERL